MKIDFLRLKNLQISSSFDTYKLLRKSAYIIALNSTVILEAGLLGKPIIIPFFETLNNKKFKDYIYFSEYFSYFDVPKKNPQQLQLILKKRLKFYSVSNLVQKKGRIFLRSIFISLTKTSLISISK